MHAGATSPGWLGAGRSQVQILSPRLKRKACKCRPFAFVGAACSRAVGTNRGTNLSRSRRYGLANAHTAGAGTGDSARRPPSSSGCLTRAASEGVVSPCPKLHIPSSRSCASTPAKATLCSRTMPTLTTAARILSLYNASPGAAFGARWRDADSLALRSAGTGEVAVMALARVEPRDFR